jgi:hypothetical protein
MHLLMYCWNLRKFYRMMDAGMSGNLKAETENDNEEVKEAEEAARAGEEDEEQDEEDEEDEEEGIFGGGGGGSFGAGGAGRAGGWGVGVEGAGLAAGKWGEQQATH